MAEILGLGITHYPPLCLPDTDMSGILRLDCASRTLRFPASAKEPATGQQRCQQEWSNDFGARAATRHRAALVGGLDRVRARLDDFEPDVVIIWGDDQYENFQRIDPALRDLRLWGHRTPAVGARRQHPRS